MRRSSGAGAIGLALLVISGCAAQQPRGLADRLIRQSDGKDSEATYDVVPIDRSTEVSAEAKAARKAPRVVPIPKTSDLPTIETQDEALALALKTLSVGESAEGHRRVAAQYRRVGVFDRAHEHLTRALMLSPRDGATFDERARTWRDARVLDHALGDASRAVYYSPGSAEAQNTLGTVLFGLGLVVQAQQRFEKAIALDPQAAYARSNLCYARFVAGELTRAKQQCDAALRLAPALEAARQNEALVAAAIEDPPS